MSLNLNFKRVGNTDLFQSDSFSVNKEEIEYILGPENIVGGDIRSMIDNHRVIPLEPEEDRRIKFCFWPVSDDVDLWVVDVVKPEGAQAVIPERLIEVLSTKDPIPRKESDSNVKSEMEQSRGGEATVWITYAWQDNENGDVDFIAQELRNIGLKVKLDRWNIQAGIRLWQQIEHFIQDKNETDAWLFYATQSSLGSERCQEEYSYALDRALNTRGTSFPMIGLFPGPIDKSIIPAGIRTRLYISTTDPDWKERIRAAAEGRAPEINKPLIDPYNLKIHNVEGGYLIEVRPRAGVWFPFSFAVPLSEKEKVRGRNAIFVFGAPGQTPDPPKGLILQWDGFGESTGHDGSKWWTLNPAGEVTPTKSFFLFVLELPTIIAFGQRNTKMFTRKL